jgi:UDP-glucuronate decarboxylase
MIPFIKERYSSINEIYHLASLASPVAYKKYPLKTLDTGYIGTKNMLDLAYHYNSKLLLASTSEIYGDAQVSPQNESYYGNVNSFGCRGCYDESKRVAEALCYTYLNEYKLDIKIARIFNTYGPHMTIDDGRIVTQTIKSLINNTELTIYGDGNQTRSCVFVDDTVDMLVRLMTSDCNIPVNIGNNEERSINETVDTIEKVYQEHFDKECKLKRNYVKLTQDDPLKRCPCLKLNKEILGETKYTSFEEGVKEMIKYFVDN